MAETQCRWFNGYKPCGRATKCNPECLSRDIPKIRILIVHLGALGAVVRSTSLLTAIKRKYPSSHITWVTQAPAHALLSNIKMIDSVLTLSPSDLLALKALEFDVGLCVDKSLTAMGVMRTALSVEEWFGFKSDAWSGAILPATPAAQELWELGLNNHQKFFVNTKPETQLICEALELPYRRDPYAIRLTESEAEEAAARRRAWGNHGESPIIGINTGCSGVIPFKKLSVRAHRSLITKLIEMNLSVVLLGGPEDEERHQAIKKDLRVIESPTHLGLRDGLISVDACDVVVSGDSLGMHMSIGLKKWVVAWFGPTCAHEIDLFDRGEKILSHAACGPCWKRSCQNDPMCFDQVSESDLLSAIGRGILASFSERDRTRDEGIGAAP